MRLGAHFSIANGFYGVLAQAVRNRAE